MSREGKLIKNTIILALGAYLPKLTAIVTLPLLTGYLTKAEYGTYDLVITLVSLLLPALTLQIQSAAFRFLINRRESKEDVSSIITNIFTFTIPISIIGLTITYFFLGNIDKDIRIIILCYFFFDIIYLGLGQVSRGLGKNAVFAIAAVINSIANMIGVCFTILTLHMGLKGIILSLLIGCLCGSLFIFVKIQIFKYISIATISGKTIKELLGYSWPMVPNALSNWVLSLSDRLVLLYFVGIEATAVYAVANKIPNLIRSFQANFTSAWQESASLSVNDNDKSYYYSTMFDSISRLLVGLIAGVIAITPIVFRLLIKGDYSDSYVHILILYLAVYFASMSQFLGGIYVAYMKSKHVGITTFCAAMCNLAIDLLMVNRAGVFAASISTLVSYLLLFVYRLIDCQKFQPLKIKYGFLLSNCFILVFMSVIASYRIHYLNIINMLLGIIFAIIINKKLIKIALNTISSRVGHKKRRTS